MCADRRPAYKTAVQYASCKTQINSPTAINSFNEKKCYETATPLRNYGIYVNYPYTRSLIGSLKAAFHDTDIDTDTDTDILARMSVSVSISMSWNVVLTALFSGVAMDVMTRGNNLLLKNDTKQSCSHH